MDSQTKTFREHRCKSQGINFNSFLSWQFDSDHCFKWRNWWVLQLSLHPSNSASLHDKAHKVDVTLQDLLLLKMNDHDNHKTAHLKSRIYYTINVDLQNHSSFLLHTQTVMNIHPASSLLGFIIGNCLHLGDNWSGIITDFFTPFRNVPRTGLKTIGCDHVTIINSVTLTSGQRDPIFPLFHCHCSFYWWNLLLPSRISKLLNYMASTGE